ncbi:MAG: ATP-binding protein [Cyanobacteriota bacterium]
MVTPRLLKILLVEDSLAEARLLQEILKGATSYHFKFAHHTRLTAALGILEQELFDLILLDLTLPDSAGLASLEPLLKTVPQIPIVVLTHHHDEQLALEAVRCGAQDYLVKRDITLDILLRAINYAIERKQAALNLLRLNADLKENVEHLTEDIQAQAQELDKVKALNQMKTEFVSMLSHDFRNPLNTILLSAGLLEESGDRLTPEQQVTYFQMIRKAIKDMDQLLSEVLVLGRSESGKLQASLGPLNLVEFCLDLIGSLQSAQPQNRHIQLTTQGDLAAGLWDANLLRHILANLLSNALKYSDHPSPVLLELIREPERVIFQITDQGRGIPPEALPELFTPFFRASNVGGVNGTGLGLAIVERCAEIHGGRVTVQSAVNQGATFTVTLPIWEGNSGFLE